MVLGEIYKMYDIVRDAASRIGKTTGLYWEIGGGSQVILWLDLPKGIDLSSQAQEAVKTELQNTLNANAPKGFPVDEVEVKGVSNQVWLNFPNRVMRQISMDDYVKLCEAIMQQGNKAIQQQVGKPSESRKPNCSMQKKKESLLKKTEVVGDDEELTFSYDGVNVMVHEWGEDGEGNYVNEYNMDVRGSFNNLTDLIKDLAKTAIYDDDYLKPDNWTVLEVDRGSLTLSASVIQDGDGNSDPDGNYIADFNIQVDCTIKKPLHQTEILNALSAARIST